MKQISEYSLKSYNTFGLAHCAQSIITVTELAQLAHIVQQIAPDSARLILGEGSNVLFVNDFAGTVLINRLKGIQISESDQAWQLHVAAGENWHKLVCYTLHQGFFGLENLALIPGCVGSAPIQNIGAYGVEFAQFCHYVDLFDFDTQQIKRLSAQECQFGYRESIFKHQYRNAMIVAVGLTLPKRWQATLSYKELQNLPQDVSPYSVFAKICETRRQKLPDPVLQGNAGSFFKNPLVDATQFMQLLQQYPNIPHYPNNDGTAKLAAGWLIDQCGLKGYQVGGAAVSTQQALVIINQGEAQSSDIVQLAQHVWHQVFHKFAISLEPEVRFIDKHGECDALNYLKNLS